jgi:hypothetical protein
VCGLLCWYVDDAPSSTVLHGVFTPAECQCLIDTTEATGGYIPALVNSMEGDVLRPDVRNSTRVMVDHVPFADLMFARVRPHVPAEWSRRGGE